jgi:TonB-dependent starch-binding outer membrane protein SusC
MKLLKLFIICLLSLTSLTNAQSQDIVIQGKVIDQQGMPLPGATITDGSNGVSSDFDGTYTIKASPNGKLVFSFLGFKTAEIQISNRTKIDVTLNDLVKGINEVVVVGYGTQKKKVVTGSISSVKAKDIENMPITRIEQSLQGRVSGVTIASNSGQPGAGSTIRIRGITTLGNNEPLWVVDGVIVDANGIGYLNQSDIESIEVLKDAASQAIYGTRASTGVILVTTKKGKAGKITVNYNGFSGFSRTGKKLDLLNATQYATLNNEAKAAAGQPVTFTNPATLGEGTDWQAAIFNNNAFRQSQEISISAGNEVSTAYLSFGLTQQEGIVTKDISSYKRKNIRLNSNHKISKWLTIGESVGYSNEKNLGLGVNNSLFGGPLSSAINLDPTTPLVVIDPNQQNQIPYNDPKLNIVRDPNGNPYGVSSLVAQEIINPLAYVKTRLGNYNWADNIVGNAFIEVSPLKDLKFKSTFGVKLAYFGLEGFTPKFYLNSNTNSLDNLLRRQTNKSFGWNIENTLLYTKKIKDHSFNLLLGQGAYVDDIASGVGITAKNLPTEDYNVASFGFNIPDKDKTSIAYTTEEHRITSIFSRLTYDYKEKYLFTGIIRRDGSSRFSKNKKYGVFPSFSAGWLISNESFWKENKILNTLKIRGGYGIVGNDKIGNFKYTSTISGGRNYNFGNSGEIVIGNSPNAPSNPDLEWEQTQQTNIGLEATLFQNFNIVFDYYNKNTTGILQDVLLPGYVGTTVSPSANIADMTNKGIEIEVGYKGKIGKVNVGANGNFSTLENEVTYLGNNIQFLSGGEEIQASTFPITRTQVGQPINSFFGYQTQGIFQNQAEVEAYTNASGGLIQPIAKPGDFRWKDVNNDGIITPDDRTFIGNSLPKYTFGFTINLDYSGFDFTLFAQGVSGNKIFQGLRRLDVNNANYQTKALSRWTGEGTSNTFPRLTVNDTNLNFSNPSDFYLEDGDYLRFKTIQIGYSLPTMLLNKMNIQKIRLYLTGENLVTLTKYTGFDPEIGGNTLGIDKGFYPQAKSYMFGVNMQF